MRKKISDSVLRQVKEVYGAIASEFDQTRKAPWKEFGYFLSYVEDGAKVLDLGCGNGRLYESLEPKKVDYLGVDNNEAFIKTARSNYPKAKFELGDMLGLKLGNQKFDVVLSIAAFHHIPSKKLRKQAVKEMRAVLKKDGVLVLTVWNLFQAKYLGNLIRAIGSFILHLGTKYAWNDLWVSWREHAKKRYYHAFVPSELKSYFDNKDWKIEEFYFVRRGVRVPFWRSYNLCIIARAK